MANDKKKNSSNVEGGEVESIQKHDAASAKGPPVIVQYIWLSLGRQYVNRAFARGIKLINKQKGRIDLSGW